MEKRNAKVNISSAGGTASKTAKTYKVTLPNKWMDVLNINEEGRNLDLAFDGRQIIISRRLSGEEFISFNIKRNHDARIFKFFSNNELCSIIYSDFTNQQVIVENYSDDPVKTAFGNNLLPTWDDFQYFLRERCIPQQRAGLREYLEAIGVSEYDPVEIIKKTAGRMAEDEQWLEIKVPL